MEDNNIEILSIEFVIKDVFYKYSMLLLLFILLKLLFGRLYYNYIVIFLNLVLRYLIL